MALVTDAQAMMRFVVHERKTSIGIGETTSAYDHVFDYQATYPNGAGAGNVGAVYSARASIVNGAPLDIDLRGSLASVLDGSTVTFPIVTGIFIKNLSTTAGQYLLMGAGSAPFIDWLIATGDGIKIGPGGFSALYTPIDGYATTATTADILRLAAATGTVSTDILIVGRAS